MSYFDGAKDWNLQLDLNKHVKIQNTILQTSPRLDLVFTSEKKNMLGMMELTVLYVYRIEVSRERTKSKYQEIINAA